MQWLRHPIAILAFTLFSGLFSLSLYSSWRQNQASGGQVHQLEQQVAQMTQEVASLETEVATASNSATQEKIIRDQLLMQKAGEQVMQIPEITNEAQNYSLVSPSPKPWDEWQEVLW